MAPYYWTILSVLVLTFAASATNYQHVLASGKAYRYPSTTRFFLLLEGLVLIFVAGLRYYVGADFGGYYHGIRTYGDRVEEAICSLDEPMLPVIATVLRWFTNDGAYFIFVCALLTIALNLRTTYKYTDCFIFATLLYVFCNWYGCFNGVRQYLAAAILFAGHRFILEKKFWKYLLVVFLAFCTHRSAIVMVIPFFVLRNQINLKNLFLLSIGTVIVFLNYDKAFEFIGFLKETEGEVTLNAYSLHRVNILRTLSSCAPAVTCVALYFKRKPTAEQTFYINALIVHAIGRIATSNSAYLARLGIYTEALIPLALAKLLKFKDKRIEYLVKGLVIVLYAIFSYVEISGSDSLSDFHWIWQR